MDRYQINNDTHDRAPTPGAIRAARAISEQISSQVGFGAYLNNAATLRELSALIDEHTAAPDMLAALKNTLSLLKFFTRETDDIARAAWDEAEAAIAKATGAER